MIQRALLHVLLLLTALLAGCAGMPPRSEPPESFAYTDTAATSLGRIAAASKPAGNAETSGFRLLPMGEFAFTARTSLAERAERSIDAQYYHIHDDSAGAAFLRSLREAAQRGVRVRLLIDDFHAAPVYPLLLGLAATPNAEVRLFNPLPVRHGAPLTRMLLSLSEFGRVNHRMHNKLFVADNAVAVFGGRNVADEYFMSSKTANFVDMDVLAAGPVVQALSQSFDRYWNSDHVWVLHDVVPPTAEPPLLRAEFDRRTAALPKVADTTLVRDPFGQSSVAEQLAAGQLQLTPGTAQVYADSPSKVQAQRDANSMTAAMRGKLETISRAEKEVLIVTPYFLPGPVGVEMMQEAAKKGHSAIIITNSLGSTDEPLVHRAYSRYRPRILELGMQLYEFSPTLPRRSLRFGNFGNSLSRLHAKATAVDRRWLVVGSVNLDARSAIYNTELGVVIDSAPITEQFVQLLASDDYGSMYQLRLAPDGRTLQWWSTDSSGRSTMTDREPGASWLQDIVLWFQSLFIDETSL